MNAHDIELALRARASFNDSVDRIDADTRRRLRDVRLRVQRVETRGAGARWIWPAGAALTAAFALAVFLPRLPQAPAATAPVTTLATAAPHTVLASMAQDHPMSVAQTANSNADAAPSIEAADPDTLDDTGFYGWLAKQPDSGKAGG